MARSGTRNIEGANQHSNTSICEEHCHIRVYVLLTKRIVKRWPDLPATIQSLLNENVKMIDMPSRLANLGINIRFILRRRGERSETYCAYSQRSLQRIVQKRLVVTVRTSMVSNVDMGAKILELAEEDNDKAWGCRQMKERLAEHGYHAKR